MVFQQGGLWLSGFQVVCPGSSSRAKSRLSGGEGGPKGVFPSGALQISGSFF